MEIPFYVKENIYTYLVSSKAKPFWNDNNSTSAVPYRFLNEVWELDRMQVEDNRFSNVKEEIEANLDSKFWNFEYVFLERLNILDDDSSFIKFIEAIISTNYGTNKSEQALHLFAINNELESENLYLKKDEKTNSYQIDTLTEDDVEGIELRKSKFKFFVISKNGPKPENASGLSEYFILTEHDWDDYSSVTTFYLSCWNGPQRIDSFGEVKIMTKGEKITMNVIPKEFSILPQKFCSLGQTDRFYQNIFARFPDDYFTILSALGDCAFYPDKLDTFENHHRFINSLVRDDDAERIVRTIKYKIFNYDLTKLFQFNYAFKPAYADEAIEIKFEFPANKEDKYGHNPDEIVSNRIYAIIGKNGTGKTQFLNSLAKNISINNEELFSPRLPGFSKMIHVSYSIFDTFKSSSIPNKSQYVYCGLKDENGELIDSKRLLLRFHNSWKKIREKQRMVLWRDILSQIIDAELLTQFIVKDVDVTQRYKVDIPKFHEVKDKMSSGQNILLFIITEIVANIRYDSLILYDEPETHLHPNAITDLVNTIYNLVDDFQSFCIIGTHSPLVVQELLSKNVLVLEREENVPSVRRIEIESFGENLSKLTEDVFGNREASKKYKQIINEQISFGRSFEQIVELLESNEVPLSLNVRLYIASQTKLNEKS